MSGKRKSRRQNRFGRNDGSPGKILPAGYDPGNIQIRCFPAVAPVLYPGEGCAAVQLPALMRVALLPGPAVSKEDDRKQRSAPPVSPTAFRRMQRQIPFQGRREYHRYALFRWTGGWYSDGSPGLPIPPLTAGNGSWLRDG